MAARMWREPLLSVESLQENVACITLGAPMITLPMVTVAMEETPQFGTTVHSIMLDSDPIPKLYMFLDPRCEEVGSEVLLPSLRKSLEVTVVIVTDAQNNNYGACYRISKAYSPQIYHATLVSSRTVVTLRFANFC